MLGQILHDGVRLGHGQQNARSARNSLLGATVLHQLLQEGGILLGELDESRGSSPHPGELFILRDYVD
ncbi:hypothetical protein QEG98_34145 [Myxococcus sp. MxC21-1]|uniref:hypothetical protein n=1 Tax=Myxococcus sp. MxC21-1 TaxID=3041439 RepID=UPI002931E444|nr:hypothetical protein [Myxococcus sp. MxC21-1]WNZ66160.1 hypothetical protein QEG98_34145 [Myxococcus sp. MxC21-1]